MASPKGILMLKRKDNKTVLSVFKAVELPILDNEELAIELDVDNLAKQAARQNIPDSEASEPDYNEQNLRSEFDNRILQAQNRVKESVSHLKDSLSALSSKQEITSASKLSGEFDKHLSSQLGSNLVAISAEKEGYESAFDDLQSFKKRNKIKRMHNYPDNQYSTIAFFIIAILVETFINGVFFAEGSDAGLVGGASTAFIISIFNVAIGGGIGAFSLTYKNHIAQWRAIMGWCGLVIGTIISIVFNLLVAHYRTAMIENPDNAAAVAMETFASGILTISDVQSWLLFLLGMLFYLGAVYKGYSADDPYPGYGRLARKRDQQYGNLDDERMLADNVIEDSHDHYEGRLDTYFEEVKSNSSKANNYVRDLEQQISILKGYHKHLESALKYTISRYRDVNVANRKSDKPKFFNHPIEASINYEPLIFNFDEKCKVLEGDREQLAGSLSETKSKFLEIKEKHQQIVRETASV